MLLGGVVEANRQVCGAFEHLILGKISKENDGFAHSILNLNLGIVDQKFLDRFTTTEFSIYSTSTNKER